MTVRRMEMTVEEWLNGGVQPGCEVRYFPNYPKPGWGLKVFPSAKKRNAAMKRQLSAWRDGWGPAMLPDRVQLRVPRLFEQGYTKEVLFRWAKHKDCRGTVLYGLITRHCSFADEDGLEVDSLPTDEHFATARTRLRGIANSMGMRATDIRGGNMGVCPDTGEWVVIDFGDMTLGGY